MASGTNSEIRQSTLAAAWLLLTIIDTSPEKRELSHPAYGAIGSFRCNPSSYSHDHHEAHTQQDTK